MSIITFDIGECAIRNAGSPQKSTMNLTGYGATFSIGELSEHSAFKAILDRTIGSGEDGFGDRDFLRFTSSEKHFIGCLLQLPVQNCQFTRIDQRIPSVWSTNSFKLETSQIQTSSCKEMLLDVDRKLLIAHMGVRSFDNIGIVGVNEELAFLIEDGKYAGYVISDPLRCVAGAYEETDIADYYVLQALWWPHHDLVFDKVLEDDPEKLQKYYIGLKSSLSCYLALSRAPSKAIEAALNDFEL